MHYLLQASSQTDLHDWDRNLAVPDEAICQRGSDAASFCLRTGTQRNLFRFDFKKEMHS